MNELFGVPVDVLTVMLAALAVVALDNCGSARAAEDDPREARRPQCRPSPLPELRSSSAG